MLVSFDKKRFNIYHKFFICGFFVYIFIFNFSVVKASLYNPGETLNPSCAPSDSNCDIRPLISVPSGASAGSLVYASSTDIYSSLTIGASGQILKVENGGLKWSDDNYIIALGKAGGQTIIGGTEANNALVIKANSAASGNNDTNQAISFRVGNLGATEAMSILNNGDINVNGDISIAGDIIPSTNNTYSLGSPSKVWRDVYIGPGSLYVNGQKVLQTDASDNVAITADINQSLLMKTYGTGDIELNPSGSGQVLLKGDLRLSSDKRFVGAVNFDNLSFTENIISARNLNGGISLTPNGNGGVYITNGNFGIGTTSPADKLDVAGSIRFSGALMPSGSSGTSGQLLISSGSGVAPQWTTLNTSNWDTAYNWGNHAIFGYVTGTPWATQGYITDGNTGWDNNYGFITSYTETDSLWTSEKGGYFKLDQTIPQTTVGTFSFSNVAVTTNLTTPVLSGGRGITSILSLKGTTGDGTLTSPAIQALVGNNGSSVALSILNNGKIGIGTTNPTNKLDLDGLNALPSVSGSASNGVLRISNTANTTNVLDIGTSNLGAINMAWIQARNSSNYTDNIGLVLNPNGGLVGVNTLNPKTSLSMLATLTGLPTLGTPSGNFSMVDISNAWGTFHGVESSGNGWIQQMRMDGSATAYNFLLQPRGGNVGIGNYSGSGHPANTKLSIFNDSISGVGAKKSANLKMANASGSLYGGQAQWWLGRWEDNGQNARTSLTLSLGDGTIQPSSDADVDVMTWLSSGKVGIGTSTPNSRINAIDGTVSELRFNSGAQSVTPTLAVGNLNANGKFAALIAGTSGAGFYYDDSGWFDIVSTAKSNYTGNTMGASGSSRLRITSSGNVGVGTTSPAEKLDVAGNIKFSSALMPGGLSGSSGQVLVSSGAGLTPQWSTLNASNWDTTYNWGNHASFGYVTGTPWTTQGYITIQTESDPIFTNWNKSTGISITESQISDFKNYLTSYTEADPIWLSEKESYLKLDQTAPQTTIGTFTFSSLLATTYLSSPLLIGGSGATSILFLKGTSGDGNLSSPAIQALVGNNGSTNALTILNDGKIGIGTSSPVNKLDVDGNISTQNSGSIRYYSSGLARYSMGISGSGGFQFMNVAATGGLAGKFVLVSKLGAATFTGDMQTGDTSMKGNLTVSGIGNSSVSGNLGIGTSSPQAKLDILANNVVLGAGYEVPGNLVIHTSDNLGADIGGSISLGGKWASGLPNNISSFVRLSGRKEGAVDGQAGGYLAFEISQSVSPYIAERMRITSTGKVGIGTTTPEKLLDVFGEGRFSSGLTIGILGTGALYSNSGALTNTDPSDLNLKQNILNIENSLSKIIKLRPVSFEWKNTGELSQGFIAQEVESILPELVGQNPGGLKGLYTTRFIPYIIKAIQEQQLLISSLSFNNSNSLSLSSLNILALNGGLSVSGHISFDEDAVGDLKILAGNQEIKVIFKEKYLEKPIITITPQADLNGSYWVSDVSADSFNIKLKEAQLKDVSFYWHAFAKKGDYFPEPEIAPVITPIVFPGVDANPVVVPASESTSEIVLELTPVVEPVVAPELVPKEVPAAESTPTPDVDPTIELAI